MSHPLDRPVWNALNSTRQARLATGAGGALRFQPGYAAFAASCDESEAAVSAMAALDCPEGHLITIEARPVPLPQGLMVEREAELVQMILDKRVAARESHVDLVGLTDADAPEMLALALLTEPGPFFAKTHQLGDFVGVRENGRLLAMAGERMKPDGFTEVSGVCVHPEARGRGLASVLIQAVTASILARGETAFLHSYPDNASAMALYHRLGFRGRARMQMCKLAKA